MVAVMGIFFGGHLFVQAVVNPIDGETYDKQSITKFDKGAIYEFTNKDEFCHR
jgi:hypothetical protein